MGRVPVKSSILAAIGYDRDAKLLEVELRDGSVYQYYAVPPDVYREFVTTSSHGRYFNETVKKFRSRQLNADGAAEEVAT
jgi:hypothetical protein